MVNEELGMRNEELEDAYNSKQPIHKEMLRSSKELVSFIQPQLVLRYNSSFLTPNS